VVISFSGQGIEGVPGIQVGDSYTGQMGYGVPGSSIGSSGDTNGFNVQRMDFFSLTVDGFTFSETGMDVSGFNQYDVVFHDPLKGDAFYVLDTQQLSSNYPLIPAEFDFQLDGSPGFLLSPNLPTAFNVSDFNPIVSGALPTVVAIQFAANPLDVSELVANVETFSTVPEPSFAALMVALLGATILGRRCLTRPRMPRQ
jgi:hypothetical protein